jgi:hypothetical protein
MSWICSTTPMAPLFHTALHSVHPVKIWVIVRLHTKDRAVAEPGRKGKGRGGRISARLVKTRVIKKICNLVQKVVY